MRADRTLLQEPSGWKRYKKRCASSRRYRRRRSSYQASSAQGGDAGSTKKRAHDGRPATRPGWFLAARRLLVPVLRIAAG